MRLERVKLKDVANWGSGGTPSRKQNYFSGDIIWFKTGEAGPKYIWDSEEKSLRKRCVNQALNYTQGFVVIAMYAGSTIGGVLFLVLRLLRQAFTVGMDQNRILNEYLYYCYVSKRLFAKCTFGGTQDNLTLEKIQIGGVLPGCLDEQRAIVLSSSNILQRLTQEFLI